MCSAPTADCTWHGTWERGRPAAIDANGDVRAPGYFIKIIANAVLRYL